MAIHKAHSDTQAYKNKTITLNSLVFDSPTSGTDTETIQMPESSFPS